LVPVVERLEGGRFQGFPTRLLRGDEVVAAGGEEAWRGFREKHPDVRRRWREAWRIDKGDRGVLQRKLRAARLAVVQAGLSAGADSPAEAAAAAAEKAVAAEVEAQERRLDERTAELRAGNDGWGLEFTTASAVIRSTSFCLQRYGMPSAASTNLWQSLHQKLCKLRCCCWWCW
jgi:ABC-type phosphate transport system auxiliary subunit